MSPDTNFFFPCHSGNYTVTFTTDGVATGPYPGTFVETATLSYTLVAGQPAYCGCAVGHVTEYSADFTIISPTGDVTGVKTLDHSVDPVPVHCYSRLSATFGFSDLPTTYTATILTATGRYRDLGASTVGLSFHGAGRFQASTFDETFVSTLAEPILIIPVNKEQCKNGGYQDYPEFKNQGRCESFVAHQQGDT